MFRAIQRGGELGMTSRLGSSFRPKSKFTLRSAETFSRKVWRLTEKYQKNSCLILGRQKLQLGRSFSCAKQFSSWLEVFKQLDFDNYAWNDVILSIKQLISWKQFYELIDARILVKLRVLSFVCLFNLSPLLMWKGVSWSGWLQQDLLFSFLRYDFKSDPRSYWNPSRARLLLTVNFSGT